MKQMVPNAHYLYVRTRYFNMNALAGLILLFSFAEGAVAQVTHMTRQTNGVYCQLKEGILRVEFTSPSVVRVQYTQDADFVSNNTAICVPRSPQVLEWQLSEEPSRYVLKSKQLQVVIDRATGSIRYQDAKGKSLLQEATKSREAQPVAITMDRFDGSRQFIEKTTDGEKLRVETAGVDTLGSGWKFRQSFDFKQDEALYGLGCHMEDFMNLRNKTLYLVQHNLKAVIPMLVSTNGYGLLFDAGCAMVFNGKEGSMTLEATHQLDYYFMAGARLDDVVSEYRVLTGTSPMMPKYLFGYIQSKERYTNQRELVDIVKEYRTRQIPLDIIVQDWHYWKSGWGGKSLDPARYPDPKKMLDDIHGQNAKLMISIWPNITDCDESKDMANRGFMLRNKSVYDAFSPLARKAYWEYADNGLFRYGVDAWWCDCTEPLDADWNWGRDYDPNDQQLRYQKNSKILSALLGNDRTNIYSLYHSQGIYENQRNTTSAKRVVNLTRSSYAGQQRYATITWNGDTYASWKSFAQQIPQGLNFMATGCPYWTLDIGAFFTRKTGAWYQNGAYDKGVEDMGYREFYTRMFQFGAFLPLFRSHGTDTPREVWRFGQPGDSIYESLVQSIRLRYRLLPYIYSLAGKVTLDNYTMTRLLAFDFQSDPQVYDIKDECMFGPSFLVCPVTQPMYYEVNSKVLTRVDKTRSVYLPKGTGWIDFWSGKSYKGGQTIQAEAPISHLPLFVRCGSIVPMMPVQQYSSQQPDAPYEIRIYPGADASFTLYEDSGDGYDYEQGAYATVELQWDDSKQTLTVSDRKGSFPELVGRRTYRIVKVGSEKGTGAGECSNPDKVITYTGKKSTVKL